MKIFAHLLYPGKHNNQHPHLTRAPFLIAVLVFLLGFSVVNNLYFSTTPKVLGFATNVYVKEIIDLTNQERQNAGLGSLSENQLLDKIAEEKGKDMFAKNYWAHAAPDGTMPWYFFHKNDYQYLYAGENLARDFYTSSAVVKAWMNSPSHKDNLLGDNYTEIGVAVLNGQFDGKDTTLIVQMFGTPSTVTISDTEQTPRTAGFYSPLGGEKEMKLLPLDTMNLSQKVYLGISLILLAIFVFDSIILVRNRVRHHERHPYFHAMILGLIVFMIVYLNRGVII